MTKVQQAEQAEAITKLRGWIKPGDTVYTVLDHVARSGMTRHIRVLVPQRGRKRKGEPDAFLHPNWAVGKALGMRHAKRNGYEQDALVVGGCGMDMGFHLVYSLSYALYGKGYKCLGKGKCPSSYHSNHRDRVRCEGVEVDGARRFCYRPDPFSRFEVPEDWPRGPERVITVEGEDGGPELSHTIAGPLLACLHTEHDGAPYEVCPTCQGEGYLPNPDGPERFDLRHQDGYALRHKWL